MSRRTFALVIAALTLVYRSLNRAMRRRTQALPTGPRIIIIVPTYHLAQQVQQHLEDLDPYFRDDSASTTSSNAPPCLFARLQPRLEPTDTVPLPTSPILLATVKDLASHNDLATPHLELIFTDEPDTILGPVLPRHLTTARAQQHPINRHPPSLIRVMNSLLNIIPGDASEQQGKRIEHLSLDFSERRPIQTVWTSATIHSQVRRFAFTRGWTRRGEEAVDLDFTARATERQISAREAAAQLPVKLKRLELAPGDFNRVTAVDPEHFALVVDASTGIIAQLSPTASKAATSYECQGKLSPVLLETLALILTTSPPPTGKYALALPPEGTSLDAIGDELLSLGVPSLLLTPEALASGLSESPSLFLARRSAVTGLHLAGLHTIYLVSGLDIGGLSPAQKKFGQGVGEKIKFYDIVTGRVGRLGTDAADERGRREQSGPKQRVVSLVLGGGSEEHGLINLFFGRESGKSEVVDEDEDLAKSRRLTDYDLDGLQKEVESELSEDEIGDFEEEEDLAQSA